jgi:thiamine biosynthesis lipoprotein
MNRELNTVTGRFFDTDNTITAACGPALLERSLELCRYYNDLLSKTVPGSDVWRISHAHGDPVEVSDHTAAILKLALEMYEVSGGRFNIAIGPVVALWHFTDGSRIIPEREMLTKAMANTDCAAVRICGHTVEVPEGMQIDLGGIAKGYIADRIAEELRTNGVDSAIVNLGGNIITVGRKPDGSPSQLGLQIPSRDRSIRDKFWAVLDCTDESVVTSGSYERGFLKDGRWYHHILDPLTGMPAENDVLSVSVCASTSLLADALTTPMFLLGPDEGMKLACRYGVDAAYYLRNNSVVINEGMQTKIRIVKG